MQASLAAPTPLVAPRLRLSRTAAFKVAAVATAATILLGYLAVACLSLYANVAHFKIEYGHDFVISDLFMPWHGARALLAGINPYTDTYTAELHRIVYGPNGLPAGERANLAAFFYPPFVVVMLAPLLAIPFEAVRLVGGFALGACIVGGVLAWVEPLNRWRSPRSRLAVIASSLAFFPVLEVLWIQQLSGIVFGLLAGSILSASRRRYLLGGTLLALAALKIQAIALPALFLLVWSLRRRERWPLVATFAGGVGLQLALSELLLSGWLAEYAVSARRYQEFNQLSYWLPERLTGSGTAGLVLALALVALASVAGRRALRVDASSHTFRSAVALAVTVNAIVLPEVSSYNRVFLLIPILLLLAEPLNGTSVRRITAKLARLGIAIPPALTGVALLVTLALGLPELPLGAAGVLGVGTALLPLFLLPANLVVAFDRGTARSALPS